MQIIGHRGARGLAPENTIAGITAALRRHVDWVEFDVHSTKDGQLVVIHDSVVYFAKRRRRISRSTLAELQATVPDADTVIPTFQAVMRAIGDRAKIMIDLKEKRCAQPVVEEINRQVAMGRPYEDFIVNADTARVLRIVAHLNPHIQLGYIHTYAHAPLPLAFLGIRRIKLHAVYLWSFAAPKFAITLAKRMGLWVVVFTVNDRQQAERFQRMGVDAIVTDRPEQLLPMQPLWARFITPIVLVLLFACILWLWFC